MDRADFNEIYRCGNPPWDYGSADFNLAETVKQFAIRPCRVLDLGCGMGNNTIWLAQHGFEVTGFDLAEAAVERAQERTAAAGVECSLQAGDFLCDALETAPFGFVFDRGCFHCIDRVEDRLVFAGHVAAILEEQGLWLSLIGNADGPERVIGPPRMTAREITEAVEPYFEILSMVSGVFGDHQECPPEAWICLMRRR